MPSVESKHPVSLKDDTLINVTFHEPADHSLDWMGFFLKKRKDNVPQQTVKLLLLLLCMCVFVCMLVAHNVITKWWQVKNISLCCM